MLLKVIVVLLAVWQVLASTPFIEDGLRAEIFELTDNEVPTFRITIPEDRFAELKDRAQRPYKGHKAGVERVVKILKGEPVEPEEREDKLKIKEATLAVEINGEKKSFEKVTFSVGGVSSQQMARQSYNIKIRGNKKLFGRTRFRLRYDIYDPTHLRSKLACDVHNRLGLDSLSANYALLYVNDEYFGFYVLLDAAKLSWIEEKFGEKDTPNLYKCRGGGCFLTKECIYTCDNENDEVTDNSEFVKFLTQLDNAKSAEEIEDIFDIDKFLYETAYEYLTGAWDHFFHAGHNFNVYKQPNGKWTIYYYDFDNEFGQDVVGVEYGIVDIIKSRDYPNYTFDEWMNIPIHLLDILVYKDQTRFLNILKRFVDVAFNPATLFARIDELKEFIRPYIEYDKTPDENGIYRGVTNFVNSVEYSLEQWDANSEFTTVGLEAIEGSGYGLKYWILTRYRKTCEIFNLECDPVYLDKDYKYTIDKNVESVINTHKFDGVDFSPFKGGNPYYRKLEEDSNSTTTVVEPATTVVEQEPTQTETQVPIAEPTETEAQESKYKCLAELAGYPCCAKGIKKVYEKDAYGEWSYDFAKKQWCGLTPYEERAAEELCWSEIYGYPCCKGCYVFESDDEGQWGYEDNQWCGIQPYCSE